MEHGVAFSGYETLLMERLEYGSLFLRPVLDGP